MADSHSTPQSDNPVSRDPGSQDPPAVSESSGADAPTTGLWVTRTGQRRYQGHSSRGARVAIGSEDVEGVFTPGELLKIALAACTGMSSDTPLARRLGADYEATIRVAGAADRDNEVYPLLTETVELDLTGLDEAAVARLVTVVTRAVDASCTVGRTLKSGTEVALEIPTS